MAEAVSHVIKSVPNEEILPRMEQFCLSLATRLHEIGQIGVPSKDAYLAAVKEIGELLDQLAIFLRHVVPANLAQGQAHPLVPFLTKMWPLLTTLLAVYGQEFKVCESVSRVLRYAVDNTHAHLAPLLPQIVQTMIQSYKEHGSSSFLWMAKKVVSVYASDDDSSGADMANVVKELSLTTFERFRNASRLDDIPDGIIPY